MIWWSLTCCVVFATGWASFFGKLGEFLPLFSPTFCQVQPPVLDTQALKLQPGSENLESEVTRCLAPVKHFGVNGWAFQTLRPRKTHVGIMVPIYFQRLWSLYRFVTLSCTHTPWWIGNQSSMFRCGKLLQEQPNTWFLWHTIHIWNQLKKILILTSL